MVGSRAGFSTGIVAGLIIAAGILGVGYVPQRIGRLSARAAVALVAGLLLLGILGVGFDAVHELAVVAERPVAADVVFVIEEAGEMTAISLLAAMAAGVSGPLGRSEAGRAPRGQEPGAPTISA